jgi:hypothetical protein
MNAFLALLKRLWPFGRRPSPPSPPSSSAESEALGLERAATAEGAAPGVLAPEPETPASEATGIQTAAPIDEGPGAEEDEPLLLGTEFAAPGLLPPELEARLLPLEAEEDSEEEATWDDEDLSEPDPFISDLGAPIEALSPDTIVQRRAEAMTLALGGDHRVFLSEAAGPGSLAEALNILAQEGKVTATFHDDETLGPYLLYTPMVRDEPC